METIVDWGYIGIMEKELETTICTSTSTPLPKAKAPDSKKLALTGT